MANHEEEQDAQVRWDRRRFLTSSAAALGSLAVGARVLNAADVLAAADQLGHPDNLDLEAKRVARWNFGCYAGFFSMDPAQSESEELCIVECINEPLIHLSATTRKLSPLLARPMPMRVNNLTWRATLRPGATFHDGSPVTPSDVKFSFDRILHAKPTSPVALKQGYIDFIREVVITGPQSVEFRLKYAFASAVVPYRIAMVHIVPEAIVKKVGDKKFNTHPVGSGPMKFVPPFNTNQITCVINPKYNGPLKVYADKVVWTNLTDTASRVTQLEGGSQDAIESIPLRDVTVLQKHSNIRAQSSNIKKMADVLLTMFNCGKPPFNDVRVRRAFMYSLDIKNLIDVVLLGNSKPTLSPLSPDHPNYTRPKTQYPHNPVKAKQLLAAAGHPNGVSFELLVADYWYTSAMAPLMQEQLAAGGFKASLSVGPVDARFNKVFAGNYSAFVFDIDFSIFSYDADALIRSFWVGMFPDKAMYWKVPQAKHLITLLDKALHSGSNHARANRYWAQAQELIAQQIPAAPMLMIPTQNGWRTDRIAQWPINLIFGLRPFFVTPK